MNTHINIIVAEDQKLFRKTLIPFLCDFNIHTIAEAENGVELLEVLKVKQADIILLDIEMPVMNGSIVLDKILVLYPKQKVVILTQHGGEDLIHHFLVKGVKAFLNKNTDIAELAHTLQLVHNDQYIQNHETNSNGNAMKFTRRECEIIPLLFEGKSNKEIANILNVGQKAVEAHKKRLFEKTHTYGTASFISYINKKGINHII